MYAIVIVPAAGVMNAFIQLEGLVSRMPVLHEENENPPEKERERIPFSAVVWNLGKLGHGSIFAHQYLVWCILTTLFITVR